MAESDDGIWFFAEGIPKGQPRPRAFAVNGKARVYDAGTAEGWKGCVAAAARQYLPREPLGGPLSLSVSFQMPRPKSHVGKRGLLPSAPREHLSKPDVDNLLKAVMDCLTTLGAWRDDTQVVEVRASKAYALGKRPGASIRIMELNRKD